MKPRPSNWIRKALESSWFWLPVLIALLVMLPRVLSAQFGLMDDGVTALNAEKMGQGILGYTDAGNSGRYRPVYWLYFSGLYRLVGANVLVFYLLHMVLLAAIVGMLALLVRWVGGSRMQAFLAGLLAVSSGPVIENFYTLSKSEPLHAFLTLAGLLLMISLPNRKTRWGQALTIGGGLAIFIMAMLAKETFAVMPFIALAWLLLGWLGKRWQTPPVNLRLRGVIFAVLAIAGLIFLLVALPSMTVQQSDNYASRFDLNLGTLLQSFFDWRAWLMRDFLYLLPAGLLWVLLVCLRKSGPASLAMLDAMVFTVAWVLIFIPWEFKAEYYLLLAGLGAALFVGLVLGGLGNQWSNLRIGWKAVSGLLAFATIYLWLTTLPNQVNNARLQLVVDRVNQQMSSFLAETVPQNGTVMVNLTPGSEYTPELALHLKYFYNRADIQVETFQYQTVTEGQDSTEYWLVTPAVSNRPVYTVRFGFLETTQRRANTLLADFVPEPGTTFSNSYNQWFVSPLRPACWVLPGVGPCSSDESWIGSAPLEYQWNIYHWSGNRADQSRPATYSADGLWKLQAADGSLIEVEFGKPGALPVSGDVDGDGQDDLALYDPADGSWLFDTNLDGQSDMTLIMPDAQTGGQPLLGDWDGDGRSSPVIFQSETATWWFYNEDGQLVESLQAGQPGEIPLVGDWNGDGMDSFGVYRPESGEVDLENELSGTLAGLDYFAPKNQTPVAGHWAGLALDTLAFYADGVWQPLYWNRDGEPVMSPASFDFGTTGDQPLAGRW
jgi:hypothetical protein